MRKYKSINGAGIECVHVDGLISLALIEFLVLDASAIQDHGKKKPQWFVTGLCIFRRDFFSCSGL